MHRSIELNNSKICPQYSFDLCIFTRTAHKRDLLGKNGFHKNDGLRFLGFPLTVENTKTLTIMGHSEDGYFKGESIEIQHKIF